MSYRPRVDAAILNGTPLLSALIWALPGRRSKPSLSAAPYLPAPPRSRRVG